MEEDLSLDKTTPIMENSFGGRTTPSKQFSKSNIGEGQDTCRRCGQVVYFAERVRKSSFPNSVFSYEAVFFA